MSMYDPADDDDKLQALIKLAGSVGAQLSNIAASLEAELAVLATCSGARTAAALALMRRKTRETEQIADLLLSFASESKVRPRVISLSQLVSELRPMLRDMLSPAIELTLDCSTSAYEVFVDPNELTRVICALVARAQDAMREQGTLLICVRPTEPPAVDNHFQLEISDTGSEVVALRGIFEPVLARKSFGLWLGLSTVYGRVRQMHGSIKVEHGLNGLRFTITIPAAHSPDNSPRASCPQQNVSALGTERAPPHTGAVEALDRILTPAIGCKAE